jgi:flagellar L-ring protein FlgH
MLARSLHISASLALAIAMAGCPSARLQREPIPVVYDSPPVIQPTQAAVATPVRSDGSLFNPGATGWSLYSDVTARSVGDIVTVRVSLSNNAEGSATTDLTRESALEAGITSLFGIESQFPGVGSGDPLDNTTPGQLIKTNSKSEFKGDGDTKRSGKITADVSALITHVYPNGNMVVHGSQSTLINNEDSLITVEGVIRPTDISSLNTISSDRIANARVEVTGRGVLSEKQRPGFLMRAFDVVWPF